MNEKHLSIFSNACFLQILKLLLRRCHHHHHRKPSSSSVVPRLLLCRNLRRSSPPSSPFHCRRTHISIKLLRRSKLTLDPLLKLFSLRRFHRATRPSLHKSLVRTDRPSRTTRSNGWKRCHVDDNERND